MEFYYMIHFNMIDIQKNLTMKDHLIIELKSVGLRIKICIIDMHVIMHILYMKLYVLIIHININVHIHLAYFSTIN